ncbi:MAG: replication initiation factor domain-containing protein, partial [Sulfobacillus sp.]
MGIHIQITGQGCRALEAEGRVTDWEAFINEIEALQGRVTRIDGALDDRAGILDMRRIYEAWINGHATSHYKTMQAQMPKLSLGCGDPNPVPETLYFGDPREGISGIRVYNKQVEQIAKGHEDPGPWIRVELVAKA